MPFAANGGRYPCEVCGRPISNAGFARDNHRRAHARRGETEHHEVFTVERARRKIEHAGESWTAFVERHGEWKGYDRRKVDNWIYGDAS